MNTPDAAIAEELATLPDEMTARARAMPEAARIDAVADALRAIVAHAAGGGGSFRALIYDRLGFSPDAYLPLYSVGGLTIANEFVLVNSDTANNPAVVALREIAQAAPMVPNEQGYKRIDGTVIPVPSPERQALFTALAVVEDALDSLAAEQEKRRRLQLQLDEALMRCAALAVNGHAVG